MKISRRIQKESWQNRMKITLHIAVCIFLSFLHVSCYQNRHCTNCDVKIISGKIIKIVDGDTYDLLTQEKVTYRIRMNGIDAPERGMSFYKVSKNFLGKLIFNKQVKIEQLDKDSYGRLICNTLLDDTIPVEYEMVKNGLAWHFKKYSDDTILANAETSARSLKIGLWSEENPIPPWEKRKLRRMGYSKDDISSSVK